MKKVLRFLKLLFITPITPVAIVRGLALYFTVNVFISIIANFVPWWAALIASIVTGIFSMMTVGHILTFGEAVAKHKKEVYKQWFVHLGMPAHFKLPKELQDEEPLEKESEEE